MFWVRCGGSLLSYSRSGYYSVWQNMETSDNRFFPATAGIYMVTLVTAQADLTEPLGCESFLPTCSSDSAVLLFLPSNALSATFFSILPSHSRHSAASSSSYACHIFFISPSCIEPSLSGIRVQRRRHHRASAARAGSHVPGSRHPAADQCVCAALALGPLLPRLVLERRRRHGRCRVQWYAQIRGLEFCNYSFSH
jgi:hypothetical protein